MIHPTGHQCSYPACRKITAREVRDENCRDIRRMERKQKQAVEDLKAVRS